MAVKPFPKTDANSFINKGAPAATDKNTEYTTINLRLPKSLLDIIEEKKPSGINRNAWILMAIHNELNRSEHGRLSP